jgi:hypothetical protein
MDNLQEAYLNVYSSEGYEPITPEKQEKIDRKKEGVKKKEDIATYQGRYGDADKQYKRGVALSFRKKMSDIGMKEDVEEFSEVRHWDEPSEKEQFRQSDEIAKNPKVQAERRAGMRARLKAQGKVPTKNGKPVFEEVVEYLFVEGFADTIESAEIMAENISEGWVNEILEAHSFPLKPSERAIVDRIARRNRGEDVPIPSSTKSAKKAEPEVESKPEQPRKRRKLEFEVKE